MGIREVAKTAGFSPSTTALALKGGSGVAAETVARVREAARRLNYRPGKPGRPRRRPGQPKASRRTHRLALISWGLPEAWLNTPVYMAVIRGVEESVREHGKALVLSHVPPGAVPERTPPIGSVDGAVLFGSPAAGDRQSFEEFPCVRIMGADLDSNAPWDHITYDDRQVGVIAADYLLSRGLRHVAFVGNMPKRGVDRGLSFMQRVKKEGAKMSVLSRMNPLLVTNGSVQSANAAAIAEVVDGFVAMDPRPQGLFVQSDAITQALQPALTARGIRPGCDVVLVSCNNEQMLLNGLIPRPATIDIHAEMIGRRAVEQLLARIDQPEAPRVALALKPELVGGEE